MTKEIISELFQMNGFKEITVTCPDGAEATIVPCFPYGVEITSVDQAEYFLVHCDLPWEGGSDLGKIVDRLNRHAELVEEENKEKDELRRYFDEHQRNGWDDDSFSWYSDWHKDVYGFRPHGYVCGEYVRPY